jgi:hypothetical protein
MLFTKIRLQALFSKLSKRISTHELIISAVWVFLIFIVNPLGEFYVNDDWSYTINAKAMALDNAIVFHDWGAMTLFAHTVWGALFCKIFGFSFTVLRLSTLVLSLVCLLAFYRLCLTAGFTKIWALAGTALLAFNPFFFQNAYSYMTEVPFLTFLILSSIHSLRLIENTKTKNIIWASVFAIIAILIRQTALLVPLSLALVSIVKPGKWKAKLLNTIPLWATGFSLFLFNSWRKSSFGLSHNFGKTSQILESLTDGNFITHLDELGYCYFGLWGLFLLPLLLLSYYSLCRRTNRYVLIISKVALLLAFLVYRTAYPYIFIGNTFGNLKLGVMGVPSASLSTPTRLGNMDWDNLTMITFLAGLVLFQWMLIKCIEAVILMVKKKHTKMNYTTLFSLIAVVGYFLFLMISYYKFDRYCLTAVPFLILILLPKRESIFTLNRVLFLLFTAVIALFSITATHDYMAWNRAYWQATEYAIVDLKGKASEFNEDLVYHDMYAKELKINEKSDHMNEGRQFTFSFYPSDTAVVIRKFPYDILLPPRTDTLYLEVKNGKK